MIQMHNARVVLQNVNTLQGQQLVRGAKPDATNNAVVVSNAPDAAAFLRLDNLRDISTLPSNQPGNNLVTGLFDTASGVPHCKATIGSPHAPLHMHLTNAPDSRLRAECPAASNLHLENNQGACLQAVWTSASAIYAAGNRSIAIYPNPHNLPSIIDVSGMTSWGLPPDPLHNPNNTRVIIHLSQWQDDGRRGGAVDIVGRLPYTVAQGANAVIVYGCGVGRFHCRVVDARGRHACRLTEHCVATQREATHALLKEIDAASPCAPPPLTL